MQPTLSDQSPVVKSPPVPLAAPPLPARYGTWTLPPSLPLVIPGERFERTFMRLTSWTRSYKPNGPCVPLAILLERIGQTAALTWAALCVRRDFHGMRCYPSRAGIARIVKLYFRVDLSKRQVKRALARLLKFKLIRNVERHVHRGPQAGTFGELVVRQVQGGVFKHPSGAWLVSVGPGAKTAIGKALFKESKRGNKIGHGRPPTRPGPGDPGWIRPPSRRQKVGAPSTLPPPPPPPPVRVETGPPPTNSQNEQGSADPTSSTTTGQPSLLRKEGRDRFAVAVVLKEEEAQPSQQHVATTSASSMATTTPPEVAVPAVPKGPAADSSDFEQIERAVFSPGRTGAAFSTFQVAAATGANLARVEQVLLELEQDGFLSRDGWLWRVVRSCAPPGKSPPTEARP